MVTVISLFAGCGGSSLGYKMAGYKELLAIEWDTNAVETFQLNFPDVPIWQRDINEVTGKEILKFCKIKKGELDVLDGSPPCQGFSTAGKRNVNDLRNDLFKQYSRLLIELQPKVFVMENVSGMMKGKMKGMFLEILAELKSCGYNVKCKLMNAMWYNVPQSRERLIFIGVRNDLDLQPVFPEANKTFITVRQAFSSLKENIFDCPPLSERFKSYWYKAGQGGSMGNYSSSTVLELNKPSPTLQKSEHYGGVYHPTECRPLTTSERKRIASFPDEFNLISFRNGVERLGNSVPPNMMKAIAECIRINILNKLVEKPSNARR